MGIASPQTKNKDPAIERRTLMKGTERKKKQRERKRERERKKEG